jgi:hypothetical protein
MNQVQKLTGNTQVISQQRSNQLVKNRNGFEANVFSLKKI